MRKGLIGAFLAVLLLTCAYAGTSSLQSKVTDLKTGTYLPTPASNKQYALGYSYNPTAYSNNPDFSNSWPELQDGTATNLKKCKVYASAIKFRSNTGAQFPACAAANPCTLTVQVMPSGASVNYTIVFPDDIKEVTSGTTTDKYIVSGQCTNTATNIDLGCVPGRKSVILLPIVKWIEVTEVLYNLTDNAQKLWWWTRVSPSIESGASGCDTNFPTKHSQAVGTGNTYNYCMDNDDSACIGDGGSDKGITSSTSNCENEYISSSSFKTQYNQYLYFCDARLKFSSVSGYIEEPSFCNFRCSCTEKIGSNQPGPSCGTCSSAFEDEINCPADCCEWNCGGTLDGGKYGVAASDTNCPGFKAGIETNFAEAAKWQVGNATFENAQCHYSLKPENYGNCSVYCGADYQCGGGATGAGVKPATSMCNNQCMDTCGRIHTSQSKYVKDNFGIQLINTVTSGYNDDFRNTNISSMLWYDSAIGTIPLPTTQGELDAAKFTISEKLSKINEYQLSNTCETALGETGITCPIDCCVLRGCDSTYNPGSGVGAKDGCVDLSGDTIPDFGFKGTDVNKVCIPSCSLEHPLSTALGSCSNRLAGSENCTADCQQRYADNAVQVRLFDTPGLTQIAIANRKSLLKNNAWEVASCTAGFLEIAVPYPIYCDDSNAGTNMWGSVTGAGDCYINFTVADGQPLPVVPGKPETTTTVSYRINKDDIVYKKMSLSRDMSYPNNWATDNQLQSGVEGTWYSVIMTSEGKPILYPCPEGTGIVNLDTKLLGFTEIGDAVEYKGDFIQIKWSKQSTCTNAQYCRSIYPEFCAGTSSMCDTSSFKCVEFSQGPIDPRLFTARDAAFCCKQLAPGGSGAGCTLDAFPNDWVFKGYESFPAACYADTVADCVTNPAQKTCNSRLYGYNPPNPNNFAVPWNYLTPCKTYHFGITENGGPNPTTGAPFNAYDFKNSPDKVTCGVGTVCEVNATSTYNDYFNSTKGVAYTGDNFQLVVPNALTFTLYGGIAAGKIDVNLSNGARLVNGTLAFKTIDPTTGGDPQLCMRNQPCRSDADCTTKDTTCGMVGTYDSKATYCDLSTRTCKCVCDSNPYCDVNRAGTPESTLTCKSTCCRNLIGLANPSMMTDGFGPLSNETGRCDFNCAPTMDAAEKFPDDWCRDKEPNKFGSMCTLSQTGKYCVHSCGNNVCDTAAGENYTTCAKDCCARDTTKDPTKNNYLPYTIDASTQFPICVAECLQESYLLPEEKTAAQGCLGKWPGSSNCDIKCLPKPPELKPVLFSLSGSNRYENLCTNCPAGSEGSCSAQSLETDIGGTTPLVYCTTYPTGVKLSEPVSCSAGCSLSLNGRTFSITDSDIVCLEYSKQSLSMHSYSKQTVKGQVKAYCTQYAICPKTVIPQITIGKVGLGDLKVSIPVSLDRAPYSTRPTDPLELNIQSCPSGCTCRIGMPCNQNSDCALYNGKIPMYCEGGKCISKCGNGVCDAEEDSDLCPKDCCEPNPAKPGNYFVYNRTGYCTYSCGAPNNECIGKTVETDYSEEGQTFACDEFCTSSEKAVILSTYVQMCSASTGTCNETGERQLNITTDMSVYLVEDEDDLFVRFGLKLKEPGGNEKIIYEPEGLRTTLTINGQPFTAPKTDNPVLGSSQGGWHVPFSDRPTGTYQVMVNATHPAYLDARLEFPVHVSKLQSATVTLSSSSNSADRKNCFYRTVKGAQNCGVGMIWVNVSSRDQTTRASLQGDATCTYDDQGATKTFTTQLDKWTSIDATGFVVGIKKMSCEVRVNGYLPSTASSTFTVRGIVSNATVEMPPEITPATPISLIVRVITDEKGAPILSPSFSWLVVNYPETGDITKFCESQSCPEGLPGSVLSGSQTILLQIKKVIPSLGELYDPLTQSFTVMVKDAIRFSLKITPKSKSVFTSGGKPEFIASIQNDGNKPINITLTLLANETIANWTEFSSTNRTILAGRPLDQKLTFTVPANPVGSYPFNLTAMEASQGIERSIDAEIKVVNQTIHNVSLSASTNLTMTLLSNATVRVNFTISNDGNVDETFDLSLQGSGARIASLNATSLEMKAGAVSQFDLRIDATVGIHEFRVCAKSSKDPAAESCMPALITVLQERIDILVPDSVEAVQGENFTLPIELKGLGRALMLLEGDSVLTSWLPVVPDQVEAPSTFNLTFVPAHKGNYTLSITLLLSSGKTANRQVQILVTPPEMEVQVTAAMDDLQKSLDDVDRKVAQLKNQGVQALYVDSLLSQIEKKRADINDLLAQGDYEGAQGLVTELKNLVKQAQDYSKIALKTGIEAQQLDLVPIIIGVLAILVGAGGLYVFGIRDNASTIQPSMSARQLPISQAPSQLGPNRQMYGRQYPQYPQQPPRRV